MEDTLREELAPARRTRGRAIASCIAGLAIVAGAIGTAGPAEAAYPRGYMQSAYLRAAPTTNSTALALINNQWVDIMCWTTGQSVNGTAKWFKAQYYSSVGYLSASVVSSQPTVGPC